MWIWSGILLAISLSMDALGIGVSYGLRGKRVPLLPKIIISLISLAFTAAAIGIGNVIVLFLPDQLAKLIGSGMLGILGVGIIIQALSKKSRGEEQKAQSPQKKTWEIGLKPLGLTIKIIRNEIHKNGSNADSAAVMGIRESLYMGVALSIDSFGAGISSAVSGINNFFVPVMVGLCQFIFLSLGIFCGQKLTSIKKADPKIFMLLSGAILVVLAIIRYLM